TPHTLSLHDALPIFLSRRKRAGSIHRPSLLSLRRYAPKSLPLAPPIARGTFRNFVLPALTFDQFLLPLPYKIAAPTSRPSPDSRSEEHTSELQSLAY